MDIVEQQMILSEEQKLVVDSDDQIIRVQALPGTGKTHTLKAIAQAQDRGKRILFLCFNSSLRTSTRKKWGMSSNVDFHTSHSLARSNGHLDRTYGPERLVKTLSLAAVRRALNTTKSESKVILRTLNNFLLSADDSITDKHVKLPSIPKTGENGIKDTISTNIKGLTKLLWSMMQDKDSDIPIGHSAYLKIFCLEQPSLNYSLILADESQDLCCCVQSLIISQNAKTVFAGDQYQELYAWLLSSNTFDGVHREANYTLTCSFRFGQTIARISNVVLAQLGSRHLLTGNDSINSIVGDFGDNDSYTVLSRTNVGLIEEALGLVGNGKRKNLFFHNNIPLNTIVNMVKLKLGKNVKWSPMHKKYKSYNDLCERVSHDSKLHAYSRHLFCLNMRECQSLLVRLEAVTDALVEDASDSDIQLATAYQKKGSTIENVKICDDFECVTEIFEKEAPLTKPQREELMVLFVALTRAQRKLSLPKGIGTFLLKHQK